MKKDFTDGSFAQAYIDQMTEIQMKLNPNVDEEKIRKIITKEFAKSVQNPRVTLDNNYKKERAETSLLSVLDWVIDTKPIICGNATFYKNQHEAYNPIAKMLEGFLTQRKIYKKQMFKIEDSTSRLYKSFDLKQGNEKRNANSYYGGSGAPTSAFYSQWSGPATTYSARSVISTAEQLFEGLLGDNYIYLDITEALQWCERNLIEFEKEYNDDIDDFLKIQSVDAVCKRIGDRILDIDDSGEDLKILKDYIKSLSEEERSILYYKNNLLAFLHDHKNISDIVDAIFKNVENLERANNEDELDTVIPEKYKEKFVGKSVSEWNKFVNIQYFMDPNDPPESISGYLKSLSDYIKKYVYCRYLSPDRVYRLQNFKRKCVTVIDTDSNILSLDTAIDFIMESIIENKSYGRDGLNNIFIAVNMLAYIATNTVTDILLTYGEYSNIPEEFRPIYSMKNEFFFLKLVIGMTKKRYISKILLREGNLMNPPKYDIKGLTKQGPIYSNIYLKTKLIAGNSLEPKVLVIVIIFRIGQSAANEYKKRYPFSQISFL